MSQHLLINPDFPAYLSSFIEDMRSGKRQTVYGRHYSDSSIQAARQTLNVVESFRKSTGSHLRFKDLDMDFYQNFVQFLYDRGYSTNSIGKYLHAITDFERISDHCSNIAVYALQGKTDHLDPHSFLNKVKSEQGAQFKSDFDSFDARYKV